MDLNVLTVILASCLVVAGAQQYGDLRLMDGGRVEIYINGEWGTVDAGTDDSTQRGPAQTVCRQLGYYDSINYGTVKHLGINPADDSVPMAIERVRCNRNAIPGSARQHILRCDYENGRNFTNSTPNHDNDFAVICTGSSDEFPYNTQVQLVQGTTGYTSSGFVEIYNHGSWGPVCNMNSGDADTVCRQLGYTNADSYNLRNGYIPNGKDDAVDDFDCFSISYACIRNCFDTSMDYALCFSGHNYVTCTYVVSDEGLYGSGDETVCSLKSIIALAIGIGVAVLVLMLLACITCVLVCCCCIPGCLIHSSRRKVTYEAI